MNQIEALNKSIDHWEDNCNADEFDDVDTSSSSCECCRQWYSSGNGECIGCPIFEKTGQIYCHGTPYYEVSDLVDEGGELEDILPRCREMLKFLVDLRDELLAKQSNES